MDVGVYTYPHGDQILVDKIVNEFLSQGKFDKLRKECMSDADTKPAYQNLQQRVENTVTQFLRKQVWRPDLNKNQLRDSLRKHILESGFFDSGINRIVDQVVNPNVLATVFMPEVEEVVYNCLSIPRPTDRNPKPDSNTGDAKYFNYEDNSKVILENEKKIKGELEQAANTSNRNYDQEFEKHNLEDINDKQNNKDSLLSSLVTPDKIETMTANDLPETDQKIKVELKEDDHAMPEKMEMTSDESEESFIKTRENSLQMTEQDFPVPDSDDSVPLEINEKSLSESADSDDSIMNQMSPISQGRLTPDILEERVLEEVGEKEEKNKTSKEMTEGKSNEPLNEKLKSTCQEKRPSQFVGRIPKIKREDSESSKSSKLDSTKKEKSEIKRFGSSDESDSNKSVGKNDNEEKKSKEKQKSEGTPTKDDKKYKEDSEKKKKHNENYKSTKSSLKDTRNREKSKDRKEKKRSGSRERHNHKKSSRDENSSRHKGRHRNSRSRDYDKKKKEVEKKKNKSTDDHSKERNRKEDRRSTDRDSNEREKDKSSNTRNHADNKNKEREHKTNENRKERQKENTQVEEEIEIVPESGGLVIEMDGEWVTGGDIVIIPEGIVLAEEVVPDNPFPHLNYSDLYKCGALSKINFPKLTDDFYVKFNSTGFKYFEEWEKTKMDCEVEFKEFVDEANNNLELISDDDSDYEVGKEFNFEEENRKTITNLLKGLGNFRKAGMFDLKSSEFYRWTTQKFYQKFRRKCEERERRSTEKESDDSIKENIIRVKCGKGGHRKDQALHLKVLNKYKKRAMTQGKQKRSLKKEKDVLEGVKENTDNRCLLNGAVNNAFKSSAKEETWKSGSKGSKSLTRINSEEVTSSELNNSINLTGNRLKNLKKIGYDSKIFISEETNASDISLTLPLSPDSDDISADKTNFYKRRAQKVGEAENSTPKKLKRNYSQKYDSQDLYKPRPVLNSTRTRGKEKDVFSIS